MTTHRAVLDLWATQQELLDALKAEGFTISQPAISNWRTRNDVPSLYWPALVKIAQGRALPDGSSVTLEMLASSQRKLREATA